MFVYKSLSFLNVFRQKAVNLCANRYFLGDFQQTMVLI